MSVLVSGGVRMPADDANEERSNATITAKTSTKCQFDVPPDGVLRGHAYVSTLEARIQFLERELRAKVAEKALDNNGPRYTPDTAWSEPQACERVPSLHEEPVDDICEEERIPGQSHPPQGNDLEDAVSSLGSTQRGRLAGAPGESPQERQTSAPCITVLDVLHTKTFTSDLDEDPLPDLPSDSRAKALVDTVYFYTQARYCIIDWTQLREWHRDREAIAYASTESPVELQTGAFFIWIIYAIGACLVPNPESSTTEAYFARARIYVPAVMGLQDLTTVQALLCLTQYYYRAPVRPAPLKFIIPFNIPRMNLQYGLYYSWHWNILPADDHARDLVGLAMRLCIKLRYHRRTASFPGAQRLDPYTIELQKRFFWCAYCFDRLLSILSKLPFGISDSDIDVELPVDVDDTCTDQQTIRRLQIKQAIGEPSTEGGTITTMTAALHHLQVYRIRSKILTKFTGPHAQVPSLADVESLLMELDQWRQRAPRKEDSKAFPQQNSDRVQANYFQGVMLLIRPLLTADSVDLDLIQLCVEFAADACESAKALSLNPLTLPDRITVYHCFYGGITLLQCLAIKPTALTPRRAHQAISACLSGLAVYTRVLPAVAPFLRLFENVSNLFVCDDRGPEVLPNVKVRSLLNKIVSSDPSDAPDWLPLVDILTGVISILHSWSKQESQQATLTSTTPEPMEGEEMTIQFDSILGGQSSVLPIDMPLEISPLYAPDAERMDLWTAPWMDLPSTEFF
ncbi:uncharacterized protein N7459_009310 [Penicillium hispanicum]|uniref:uncharacterized protein n=1 Tax=Penicillium hispanicum TaxID=1080232 RepID=UPI002540CE41|nr:uncharacterized protein N7459_009310 [Penicillium hispanicum]KAJ5569880.1 hypothetical protein N7459_009310 [Penicillium hispanicum]